MERESYENVNSIYVLSASDIKSGMIPGEGQQN